MAKDYETADGSRIAPLGEVDDFEVAEGYPDVRGWRVDSADGVEIGKVHELLVDLDAMRTRYLDVRLTNEVAAAPEDRDVLVPIGAANVQQDHDVVRIPLTAERVGLLPPYLHGPVTPLVAALLSREPLEDVMRRHSLTLTTMGPVLESLRAMALLP